VLPYLVLASAGQAFGLSLVLSLAALTLLGTGIGLLTRRPIPFAALRQVILGGVAAAVTFAVGQAIGGPLA